MHLAAEKIEDVIHRIIAAMIHSIHSSPTLGKAPGITCPLLFLGFFSIRKNYIKKNYKEGGTEENWEGGGNGK